MALRIDEQDLRVAGMSAYMQPSDQFMTNMGLPQAAFLAVGSDEGALNLVNADTLTTERIAIIQQENENNRNDDIDIAMAALEEETRERLERLREGGVGVSFDGVHFTIGNLKLTEEELDDVVEDAQKDPEAFAKRHNLSDADKQAAIAMFAELAAAQTPEEKAGILARYDRTNPSVTAALEKDAEAQQANNTLTNESQTTMTAAEVEAKTKEAVSRGSYSAEQADAYENLMGDHAISPEYQVAAAIDQPESSVQPEVSEPEVVRPMPSF